MLKLLRFVMALSMVALVSIMFDSTGAKAAPGGYPAAQTTLPAEVLQYEWVLEYFNTDAKSAGHDMTAAQITVKFAADGSLSGFAGCNDYFGSYTVSGQQMTISKLGSTQKACPDPAMSNETLFLSLLPTVNAYALNTGKLDLIYSDGHNAMTFIPGASQGAPSGGQPGASSLPADIVQAEWTLQYFTSAAAQDVSSNHITIKFETDGTFSGNGGCNNYFGSYTVSNQQLTIAENIGSTAMFCEQAVMARESLYFRTLLSVNSFQVTNGKLELIYGDAGTNYMTFTSGSEGPPQATQLPAPVLGTSWTLKSLDSNDTAGQDLTGSGVTIKFEPDGTFYGFDGCNNFSGTYTVSGGKLTIGSDIATTRKVCPEADPQLESRFLQLLSSVKSYTTSGDQLSLDYEDTGSSLVFVRTTLAVSPRLTTVTVGVVGMPTTGAGTGTPLFMLLLLAGSLVALVTGFGLRRQVARKTVRNRE